MGGSQACTQPGTQSYVCGNLATCSQTLFSQRSSITKLLTSPDCNQDLSIITLESSRLFLVLSLLCAQLRTTNQVMDNRNHFKEEFRFQREIYNNLNNPQHLEKFQDLVFKFIKKVRANFFRDSLGDFVGRQLINEFCALIDNDNV